MHPGNLLFANGEVCFIDFGNVREWPQAGGDGWRQILKGLIDGDRQGVRRGLCLVEMTDDDDSVDFDRLFDSLRDHLMRAVQLEYRELGKIATTGRME